MGSFFGRFFRVATFGESHGPAVGVMVEGVPPGIPLDERMVQEVLEKRRPGTSKFVSSREEPDKVEILSGVTDGRTAGGPVAMVVRNLDARAEDYLEIKDLFRPGHADYTYYKKFKTPPQPGGGRASGRETLARVAAGAVARAWLAPKGLDVHAYTIQIGHVKAKRVDLEFARDNPLRCADPDVEPEMQEVLKDVLSCRDSIGGVVEIMATGVPAGLGSPVFDKLEALLGGALLSIGGVKGVEFGDGFKLAMLRGSQANDQMTPEGFLTNRCGGTLGGISTGEPILVRMAVKPTPSIGLPQVTVDLEGNPRTIRVSGRHDPCLCPRVAPVAEAMTWIVLADLWLEQMTCGGEIP
jgi:chorismate synthase